MEPTIATYAWDLVKSILPWGLGAIAGWAGHIQLSKASRKEVETMEERVNTKIEVTERRMKDEIGEVAERTEREVSDLRQGLDRHFEKLDGKLDATIAGIHAQNLAFSKEMVTKSDLVGIEERIAARVRTHNG